MLDCYNFLLYCTLYTKLQNKGQYLEVALDVGESCTRGRHDGQDTTDSNAPAPLNIISGRGFPTFGAVEGGWGGHAPRGLSFVASHTVNNC